jgi:hypothetical protein
MISSVADEVDFIRELQLRRWARENYVPLEERTPTWHAIVLDEMSKKDLEAEEPASFSTHA